MDGEYMEYISYVGKIIDKRTKLEQLAEEAAELSKACLKLIRASGFSNNMTPVDREEALRNLREEFADVNMCYYLLFRSYETRQSIIMRPKWKRWALRLGYPGKGKEGEEQNG